jgi:hypothetical protein
MGKPLKQVKNELGCLIFANVYNSNYRHYKQLILLNEYENIQKIINDVTEDQYDNLRQMIEIEIIVNTVQYCCDLATFGIAIKNSLLNTQLLSHLAKFDETQIKDKFFKPIISGNYNSISKFMGYHEIDIDENDKEKYSLSCDRYKNDIKKISEFFNRWYYIYTAYKHGLRLIPTYETKTHSKMIIEALKDNSYKCTLLHKTWWREAIEINKLIHEIFDKLYTPLVKKKQFDRIRSSDLSATSGRVVTKDKNDLNESISSIEIEFMAPWWKNEIKEPDPFY